MKTWCKVCSHPLFRGAIEQAMRAGRPAVQIAGDFAVPVADVERHAAHLPPAGKRPRRRVRDYALDPFDGA